MILRFVVSSLICHRNDNTVIPLLSGHPLLSSQSSKSWIYCQWNNLNKSPINQPPLLSSCSHPSCRMYTYSWHWDVYSNSFHLPGPTLSPSSPSSLCLFGPNNFLFCVPHYFHNYKWPILNIMTSCSSGPIIVSSVRSFCLASPKTPVLSSLLFCFCIVAKLTHS